MALNPIYKIIKTPIDQIFLNPSNPRKISPQKFEKLVQSIKDAPWMLKLRPIVTNKNGIILGGNQRYKACCEAGMTHVWVLCADQLTDEQQRRFILRDNIDFGKWDQEIIRKQYTEDELIRYGIEIEILKREAPKIDDSVKPPPPMGDDEASEPWIPEEELEESKKNFNDNTIKQIVFQLPSDLYENALKDLNEISMQLDCDDNSEVLLRLIHFYEVGNGLEDSNYDSIEG